MFAYGFLSISLVLYLVGIGLDEATVGQLFSLTLLGDTAVSLWLTTTADRMGRRRTLAIGAVLMLAAGIVFALTSNVFFLLIAAVLGVISPSGYEVGPFLAIEQAALSQTVTGSLRTSLFAWYNLAGSFATAVGSLAGGALPHFLRSHGVPEVASYRVVVFGYAALGLALMFAFLGLSRAVEPAHPHADTLRSRFGLRRSRRIVAKLSALFGLDAFAGGFVIQSLMAYWFHIRFGVEAATLGGIFFGANVLAGISALMAARIAARVGLINTMVFTHLPSNMLLILVPLMPNLPSALAVLLFRFSISQMDVPTRQSYTMAVVDPHERSAAAGLTGIARTVGSSISPAIAGVLFTHPALMAAPFIIAGMLKIIYDLLLYRSFRRLAAPEEMEAGATTVK